MHVCILGKLPLGKMRETRAVCGAHGIDTAHIGAEIEELAGLQDVRPIAVPFLFQPLLFKGFRCLVEMGRNPLKVFIGEGRCHFLTAVGAAQAVHFFPYFRIYDRCEFINILRRIFLHPVQEASEGFSVDG